MSSPEGLPSHLIMSKPAAGKGSGAVALGLGWSHSPSRAELSWFSGGRGERHGKAGLS